MQQGNDYAKRLLMSRFRILNSYGFYGLMLMSMKFGLDTDCETAYTDGERICFSPDFMDELTDEELDFILMHEIMHVVLRHCTRGMNYNQEVFNIACDIVVNSNILKSKGMNKEAITLKKYGVSMHMIRGEEGYNYTAEEVYEMLISEAKKIPKDGLFDDHTHWGESDGSDEAEWTARILAAAEAAKKAMENGKPGSGIPDAVDRYVKKLKDGTVNWRELLNEFLQRDLVDYSFMPPDNRYDGPFFLPGFNVPEERIEDILFMVDTSGSISELDLLDAYSEIKGAIEQYNDKLKGYVGFFDTRVYPAIPFENVDDLLKIVPRGGGGTDFHIIFKYAKELENKPVAIIILTDGDAQYPNESVREDIPVLWLLNNKDVTPPWGVVARMKK